MVLAKICTPQTQKLESHYARMWYLQEMSTERSCRYIGHCYRGYGTSLICYCTRFRTQGQIIGEDKSQSRHLKYDVPVAAGKQRFRRRCSTTWLEWTMMRFIRSFVIGYECIYPVESLCMCNICFENPDCPSPAAVVRDLASKFLKACGTHSQCFCR
jgi:hypothetical protein